MLKIELEHENTALRTVIAAHENVKASLLADNAALEQRVEGLERGLGQIVEWSKAYPLDVFPEPDFKKAAKLLKAGGMTLDAISASNMRHVVEGVGGIAKAALAEEEAV